MWLEIKQLTRLQIIRYCEKLEKENKKLQISLKTAIAERDSNIEALAKLKWAYEVCCIRWINDQFKDNNLEMENKKLKDEIKRLEDLQESGES